MNQYEMVVVIVIVVMVAGEFRARFKFNADRGGAAASPDSTRMQEEIRALRERIQVLERIATDKESQLEREIERLRDR